jgi:hypothetical protein
MYNHHWPEVDPPVGFNRPCFQRAEFRIASLRADQFGVGFDEWHVFCKAADGSIKEFATTWMQQREWWQSEESRLEEVFVQAENVINDFLEFG